MDGGGRLQLRVQPGRLHRVHSGRSRSPKNITGRTFSLQAPVFSLPSVPVLRALSLLGGLSQSPAGHEYFIFFSAELLNSYLLPVKTPGRCVRGFADG